MLATYTAKRIKVFARDNTGNTALHYAVLNKYFEMVEYLHKIDPEQCLVKNHAGKSPFFLAVETEQLKIVVDIFGDYKLQALEQRDALGENMLFSCARNGNEQVFRHFMGSNEYYKARGMQNYKGKTIEHIVCESKQHPIVDEIDPKPDTPDYYGSYPFFESVERDDLEMIKKQFKQGREYFTIRNYKYECLFHKAGKYNALESL